MTTLEVGNDYDIPGLGSRVDVDYEVWASDLDRPNSDYKGALQVTHETLFAVKANISSSIGAVNVKFTVMGNVNEEVFAGSKLTSPIATPPTMTN